MEVYSPDDRPPVVAIGIKDQFGMPVYGTTSEIDGAHPQRIQAHHYLFVVNFSKLPLLPGAYQLNGHAMDPEGMRLFDTLSCGLQIRGTSARRGVIDIQTTPPRTG